MKQNKNNSRSESPERDSEYLSAKRDTERVGYKRIFLNLLLILVILLAATNQLKAQDDWETEGGEIEDVEILIEKNKKLTLNEASRLYEKVTPAPLDTAKTAQKFQYKEFNYALSNLNPKIRVLTIKPPLLDKYYANYVKAGFGNYGTPYFEAYLNNKRNKKHSYGVQFRHLSSARGPVDKKNSATSENYLGATGKIFYKSVALKGTANVQRNKHHFYGYKAGSEVSKDTLEHSFSSFYADVSMESRDTGSDLYYKFKPSFAYFSDNFQAKESEFGLNFKSNFTITEELGANLKSDLYLGKLTDVTSLKRNFFRVKPRFTFVKDNVNFDVGVNVVYENDTIHAEDDLRFFLSGKASYDLTSEFLVFAGIDGDVQRNTLRSLSYENPYLRGQVPVFNTTKPIEIYGGIEGSLLRAINIKSGVSLADYKNMYFFVNNKQDTTKFDVIYNTGNTSVLNFFAEAGVDKKGFFRGVARFDYFSYGTNNLREAWLKPDYKFSLLSAFNIYDKILLNADFYLVGGMKALNPTDDKTVELDNIADVNLKIDYRFSKQTSAFLSFKNIFSKKYQHFYNYPSKGIQVMAGITYAFDKL